MTTRRTRKLNHAGASLAEVDVKLIMTDDGWSPYLSAEDARKLDNVRRALMRGDAQGAAKLVRVDRLTPVSAA